MSRNGRIPQSLWTGDGLPPKTDEVLSQVGKLLEKLGYDKALKALKREGDTNGVQVDTTALSQNGLLDMWARKSSKGERESSSGSDSESESDEEENDDLVDDEAEETSDDSSDEESDSSEASAKPTSTNLKRKRAASSSSSGSSSSASTSSSESSSSSSSSSSSESESESDSSSSSSSSDDSSEARPKKRTKVDNSKRSDSSSSGSSTSDSDSKSSDGKHTPPASTSDSGSDSDSSGSESSSSTDDTTSEEDVAQASPKKSKKKVQKKTKAAKPQMTNGIHSTSASNSSKTVSVDSTVPEGAENDTLVIPADLNGGMHPDRAMRLPATQENIRQLKKGNTPFQRVPANTQVDPRFASNDYVSYDYADRAYQDLVVTKGKGFTKEKNKKKRGSYRGGAIDLTPKGIKFDD